MTGTAGTIGPRGRVRREEREDRRYERAERGQIEESDNSAAGHVSDNSAGVSLWLAREGLRVVRA